MRCLTEAVSAARCAIASGGHSCVLFTATARAASKATGSGHATNLIAEPANLEWIAGQDQTQRFDLPSAKSFATAVCRTCGSPVPRLSRDGQRAVIPAGSLDSTPSVQPTARIFWESRTPWSCAGDELHRFPEAPA